MNKIKFKGFLSIILVLLIILSTVSCTKAPEKDLSKEVQEDNIVEVVESIEEDEAVNPSNEKIIVIDHLNREVEFGEIPERIVSGYYISSSVLIALGLKDKVVGVEAKADSRPIYKLAAPEFLELPSVGTAKEFDLEGTIALNPDLVILPIKLKETIETLEGVGIKVLGIDPEDMDLLKETLLMIGKATNTEDKAENLINYYDLKIEELLSRNSSVKPRIYLGGNSDFLSTATSKMYQNYLIETAGGINVAGDIDDNYWVVISPEQFISYNPDIIVLAAGAKYSEDEILNDENYKDLDAIKNNRIYRIPGNIELWDSPVPSSPLGIMYLSSILYEDFYSFEDFKEDVYLFYKEFYGAEINKDEIEK